MEGLKPGSADRTASHDDGARAGAPPPLEQLSEYRILREIGRGGMGVVYEAIQETLGRRVALKILPLHGRIDAIQMQRFQLEASSAARLHHPSIVPVYGVGEKVSVSVTEGTTISASQPTPQRSSLSSPQTPFSKG
jgi:eukaryotic-like serine/threonine-protein kinase